MKRFISILLSLSMLMIFSCSALAIENGEKASPITIIKGIETDTITSFPELRAVSVPTSYAPSSYYGVNHYWTAKYYTWSSYIFTTGKGYYFDSYAKQPFSVEFFYADGTSMGIYSAVLENGTYKLLATMDGAPSTTGYYVKIINDDSSSINSNAYYCVYN